MPACATRHSCALAAFAHEAGIGRGVALSLSMTFSKILCPTDFSPGAQRALERAARLAADSGAELVVAHSWYIPASLYSLEAPLPANVSQQVIDDAQRGLDEAVREATAAGAKTVTGTLLSGLPWTEIVDQLERQGCDLCVIGTHGRTGVARVMLGSVAEKVMRHAHCSVLAVKPDNEAKPFKHVLIPTDFSEHVQAALELAPTLVAEQGKITLMHVSERPDAYAGDLPIPAYARDLDAHLATVLADTAARLRTRTSGQVSTRSCIGYAGAETLAVLDQDPSIDLIVMGSHGRTGIKRALLGSVAEKVVRHARCPVLVARKRA